MSEPVSPTMVGDGTGVSYGAPLPIHGSVEVALPVARLWEQFLDVPRWPEWNRCFSWARVRGGNLGPGATLIWAFKPIRPEYLYRMPARAEIVGFVPEQRVTWEVKIPGFHAKHSYLFESLGPMRCRFGSWEVAEGPVYRALHRFWVAHFEFVCRESLRGAASLG